MGHSGTAAVDALATCGAGAVDAAYSLDAADGGLVALVRRLAGRSNLPALNGMQGVIALGANMAPADQQQIVVQSGEPQFFDPHRSNFEQDIAIERMLFRGLYQLEATADGGLPGSSGYGRGRADSQRQCVHGQAQVGAQVVGWRSRSPQTISCTASSGSVTRPRPAPPVSCSARASSTS